MLADDVVSFERPGAGILFFLFLLMHLSCEDDHDIYNVSCMWYTCFDVLCGNYLYFSPMPSAYGPRIDLR